MSWQMNTMYHYNHASPGGFTILFKIYSRFQDKSVLIILSPSDDLSSRLVQFFGEISQYKEDDGYPSQEVQNQVTFSRTVSSKIIDEFTYEVRVYWNNLLITPSEQSFLSQIQENFDSGLMSCKLLQAIDKNLGQDHAYALRMLGSIQSVANASEQDILGNTHMLPQQARKITRFFTW